MKPLMLILLSGLLGGHSAIGASTEAARAAADREAAEERYRILRSSVDDLLESQLELRRRMDTLTRNLERVAEEARSKPGKDQFVTRAEFEKLLETVRQIDKKRESDKHEIIGRIERLGKSLSSAIASAPVRVSPPERGVGGPDSSQEGVWYEVEKDNTLSAIIVAHNNAPEFKAQGRKTSLKLILDANPGLVPETMQVGRKIWIPMVAGNP